MKTSEGQRIYFPTRHTRAPDGTRLRYFDSGEDLPAVVLANGLGGPVAAWEPYARRWSGRYRVLSWDYRGLYGSVLPHRSAELGMKAHVGDLLAILDDAQVEQAAFVGWSMGVQVGLEFYSQNPNRLTHLTLVSGTYGRPLRGVPLPFSGVTLPPLVKRAGKLQSLGTKLLHGVSKTPLSYTVLRKLRVFAPGFERSHFERMVDEFKTVDLDVYFDLLMRLHEHDARDHLSAIQVPTLVIAGSRDVITPPWFARKMARTMPNAELYVIPGGTHYSAAETPDLVAERIERLLEVTPPPSEVPLHPVQTA